MKSTVKKGSVDVAVKEKGRKTVGSPVKKKGFNYPDADAVAEKYGVLEKTDSESASPGLSLEQQMELARQQQAVVQKLENKNREVERLCTLLEAVEPIPGMDPEKYRRIIENPDADHVDFRDSKIVDLAKKCRRLQMSLTKMTATNESLSSKIDQLMQANDSLQLELQKGPSMMNNSNNSGGGNRTINASTSGFLSTATQEEKERDRAGEKTAPQLAKELAVANKRLEESRRSQQRAEEEAKKLTRALMKEVGDGVTLEEAVDEGRKGRMQQIVMLKNKVKRLEMAASQSGSTTLGSASLSRASRADVDSQAEEELEYMSSVRKIAVEELSEAHSTLQEQHNKLLEKHQGAKARVRTLENDAAKHKQQIKIILDKTETDDHLITALKDEIHRLKTVEVRNSQFAAGGSSSSSSSASGRGVSVEERVQKAAKEAASMATSHAEGELTRLRRLTKQQAEQLATQEQLIKELRRDGKGGF